MKCIFEVNTICRLCLRVDEKVYRLDNAHKAFIESIIRLKQFHYLPTDDQYVCYICNALLTKTLNFMQTIWNAQDIVCDILKTADKITKPMLEHIDRNNNGLNPITLSSVVICENVKDDSCNDSNASTEIEELDLDLLIDKQSNKKQNYKNNCRKIKTENHSKKEKLSSCSDEDKEPDNCYLDEVEVEIEDIKTESGDPLTKGSILNTHDSVHDDPKPQPKNENIAKKKSFVKKMKASTSGEQERKRKKKDDDDDYHPDSTSHSEDSDYDSYDDEGKPIKRPKNNRVYPRKCDHCNYDVPKARDHYRHYLWAHPNVEYPYKLERNNICSICGKLCTKEKLRGHEESHATQKLKCLLCSNIYSNKKKLYAHMQRVHPKTTFTCDYCSKTFKTRIDITRHIRIHTGSKPYKCHICGDAFAHSGNRTIHIRIKHQNYKYVPKKPKRAQKKRRSNKHYSTDSEISSNNEKTPRRTKRNTKTKM